MRKKQEYISLSHALVHLKKQVIESIPFARKHVPKFANPEQLFYYLKQRVIYRRDPPDIELFMTMQTMFAGTRTGTPGAGDCDDFTIVALACCIAQGWINVQVVLVGRSKANPVHIYSGVVFNGLQYWFDLTNPTFNYERKNYKYKQVLQFKI